MRPRVTNATMIEERMTFPPPQAFLSIAFNVLHDVQRSTQVRASRPFRCLRGILPAGRLFASRFPFAIGRQLRACPHPAAEAAQRPCYAPALICVAALPRNGRKSAANPAGDRYHWQVANLDAHGRQFASTPLITTTTSRFGSSIIGNFVP